MDSSSQEKLKDSVSSCESVDSSKSIVKDMWVVAGTMPSGGLEGTSLIMYIAIIPLATKDAIYMALSEWERTSMEVLPSSRPRRPFHILAKTLRSWIRRNGIMGKTTSQVPVQNWLPKPKALSVQGRHRPVPWFQRRKLRSRWCPFVYNSISARASSLFAQVSAPGAEIALVPFLSAALTSERASPPSAQVSAPRAEIAVVPFCQQLYHSKGVTTQCAGFSAGG
jgi:hypothetical protein